VQFQAQAKEVKVKLEFSDVAKARAVTLIEVPDFESRLATALSQKNPDDSAVDASAFEDMKVVDLSAQFAQKPRGPAGDDSDEEFHLSISVEMLIVGGALALVLIIIGVAVAVVLVERKNAKSKRLAKTLAITQRRASVVIKEDAYALNMDEIPDIPAEVPENRDKKGDKKRRDTYSAPEDAEGMST